MLIFLRGQREDSEIAYYSGKIFHRHSKGSPLWRCKVNGCEAFLTIRERLLQLGESNVQHHPIHPDETHPLVAIMCRPQENREIRESSKLLDENFPAENNFHNENLTGDSSGGEEEEDAGTGTLTAEQSAVVIARMQEEMVRNQQEMAGMRQDMVGMRQDMVGMRQDMAAGMRQLNSNLQAQIEQLLRGQNQMSTAPFRGLDQHPMAGGGQPQFGDQQNLGQHPMAGGGQPQFGDQQNLGQHPMAGGGQPLFEEQQHLGQPNPMVGGGQPQFGDQQNLGQHPMAGEGEQQFEGQQHLGQPDPMAGREHEQQPIGVQPHIGIGQAGFEGASGSEPAKRSSNIAGLGGIWYTEKRLRDNSYGATAMLHRPLPPPNLQDDNLGQNSSSKMAVPFDNATTGENDPEEEDLDEDEEESDNDDADGEGDEHDEENEEGAEKF